MIISVYYLLANVISVIRQFGEFHEEFRQLANKGIRNFFFFGESHTSTSPIGEFRGEFRQWRIYSWRNSHLAKLQRLVQFKMNIF